MTEQTEAGAASTIKWMVFDNQPRRNAMNLEMWRQAAEDLSRHDSDPNVRVVVMRGAGEQAFVSGADISQFETQRNSAEAAAKYAETSDRARNAMSSFSKPLIAMIRGFCFGAGVDIAMRADVRIAGDDAIFCIPAGRLGLTYGFDSVRHLVQLTGSSAAKDLLFSARRIDAQEALRIGLVNRVVPAAELEAAATAYADSVAANAPLSLRSAKFSADQALRDPDQRNMRQVEALIAQCYDSQDYKEGRLAFKEKRSPVFIGR